MKFRICLLSKTNVYASNPLNRNVTFSLNEIVVSRSESVVGTLHNIQTNTRTPAMLETDVVVKP